MSWNAPSQLNPKGASTGWKVLMCYKLEDTKSDNYDLFKLVKCPLNDSTCLSVTRYVKGKASKERLSLRFKEVRHVLDNLRSTKEVVFGSTDSKYPRQLSTGLRFTKATKKFFIKQIPENQKAISLEFAYSKVPLLERAFGNAWVAMNIRNIIKPDAAELATKSTTMIIDSLITHAVQEAEVCMELCCASQRDWAQIDGELSFCDLPACLMEIVKNVLGDKSKLESVFNYVNGVLGHQTELEMSDDEEHLTAVATEVIRKRKLEEELDEEAVIPTDFLAFLIAIKPTVDLLD